MKHVLLNDAMDVDLYPVGALSDLQRVGRIIRYGTLHPTAAAPRATIHAVWASSCASFRRNWRRKSYWNGYLAEPTPFPEGLRRCGSGWTKQRALNDLRRRLAAVGLDGR